MSLILTPDKEKEYAELGWPKERLEKFEPCKFIKPKNPLNDLVFGELLVLKPIGYVEGEIVYKCRCKCGKGTMKTPTELEKFHPHCGCLKNHQAYAYWEKNRDRFHTLWSNNYERFLKECYESRGDKKYLIRRFKDRKLSQSNFFWSNSTEHEYKLHEQVVEILIKTKALTHQGANEQALSMNKKRKLRFITAYEKSSASKIEKLAKMRVEEVEVKTLVVPTKAMMKLLEMLGKAQYDEQSMKLHLSSTGKFLCKIGKLPTPMAWNEEKGEWDL